MIFDKVGNTTIVFQENISLQKFVENLLSAYPTIQNDNIIVNLFSFSKLSTGDVLEFFQLSESHKKKRKSFVLVSDRVSFNELPHEIIVVPTLQEAKDIIEMEEIERDLEL